MELAIRKPISLRRMWASSLMAGACLGALYFGHGRSFLSISWDRHAVNCLPELHLALLVHFKPSEIKRGDYLFWRASSVPALAYVTDDYVLKKVAGIPGDILHIRDGKVLVNNLVVAEGLEDAVLYRRQPADFERSEVIPPGRYFVIGTARMSNDSRYWGFLPHEAVVGTGYRIY